MSINNSGVDVNLNNSIKTENSNNAEDNIISLLIDEEQVANENKENNSDKNPTSKAGQKSLIGGSSEEMLFTLSQALRKFLEFINHLLNQ